MLCPRSPIRRNKPESRRIQVVPSPVGKIKKVKVITLFLPVLLAGQSAPAVKLRVSGLPPGQTSLPAIAVALPGGKNVKIESAAQFSASEAGRYRVTPAPFRFAGTLVDSVFEAPPVDRVVKPGESVTLEVAYRPRTGSGMLWAATARIDADTDDFSKGTVRAIAEPQLLSGGFSKPSAQLLTGPRLAGGIAGPDGSFYFVDGWNTNALMRLAPESLLPSGAAKATRVPGTEPHSFAISPAGELWSLHDRTLKRLSAGSLTPSKAFAEIAIREEDDGLPVTHFLFTASGDLLLYGPKRIARISLSTLTTGARQVGRADAAAIVDLDTGTLGHGALDEAGDLWIPDENGEVLKVPRSAMESGGNTRGNRFELPQSASAVQIDNQGGVWCLIRYTGELFYRAPGAAKFVSRGTFGRGFDEHTQLTFNPPPPWSPLAAAPAFPKRLAP